MKILNPNYVKPAPDANAPYVKYRAAVLGALAAAPGKEMVSFAEVRAALAMDDKALPDGAIHQICLDAEIEVKADA